MCPSFINVAPLHGIAHHQLLFVRSDRRCEAVLTSLLPAHNSDIGIVKLWPYFAAKVTLIRYWLPELPMSICAIQVLLLVCIALEPKHPCLAANLRIGIYNGKWFLTDYTATHYIY